jgi:type I restriction enzyme S subunit
LKSVFQKDDVLFGKLRAYLRKYWLADRTGVCSTEIWVLMANAASLIPPYLFQLVRTDRFIEAASTAYGTHMPRSDWKVVKDFELLIPPPEEQTVIADVLSDMDAEIAAVETKLTKARQIKQGMMQELLTGRIRLVRPSAQILSFPAKESASATDTSHNTHFNEAVVIAVLSSTFGSEKFPLGRFRRTKFSYLLHRHAEQVAAGFLKKAAGPYNPRTRYGGAEKIAVQNRYVRVVSTGKSEGFVADENIAQAEGYFEKWYGAEALTWLEQFRYQKNDALELLTTVDMACEDLSKAGKVVATSTVKQIIQDSPEWKAKLNRSVFSDDNIAATIETCRQLFSR